ncbi:MAG TPA: hypothetical protein VFS96_00165 [Nitrolancea sp.]|nr:hypothetical protein [Nitrolancea sp.]
MNDDDELGEPASESTDSFDQINGQSAPAVGHRQWTAQEILVRVVIAAVIVLVMIGSLLVILQNVFNVLSSIFVEAYL